MQQDILFGHPHTQRESKKTIPCSFYCNVYLMLTDCSNTQSIWKREGVPPFPNWRSSRGRPSITWLHQICSDCGLSAGDALKCAQDRAVWRTYAMGYGLLGLALTTTTSIYGDNTLHKSY